MPRDHTEQLSEFLQYISTQDHSDSSHLPSLAELSKQMGISISSLREQLEVARALGLVDVRPKTGIRLLPYTFRPAIQQSVSYAIAIDPNSFKYYADLRKHIEISYWFEAVSCLTPEDQESLRNLIKKAKIKLMGWPMQVPHAEHRELHLSMYRRLGNPFVIGVLETYWELYEAVGLNILNDANYISQVWRYHEKIVEDICIGDFNSGYQSLVEHMDLLKDRPKTASKQKFE